MANPRISTEELGNDKEKQLVSQPPAVHHQNSTMEEPHGVGAIVRAYDSWSKNQYLWMRGFGGSWVSEDGAWGTWDVLRHPELVHEGYLPRTPAPTNWGAVVRDANGVEWSYVCAKMLNPWRSRALNRERFVDTSWGNIPQPVEILFGGVE